jgi:hypothetical protein
MQVVWMLLVTLGLALGEILGRNPGNRLGHASVTSHPPSFAGPWLEWRSGAPAR